MRKSVAAHAAFGADRERPSGLCTPVERSPLYRTVSRSASVTESPGRVSTVSDDSLPFSSVSGRASAFGLQTGHVDCLPPQWATTTTPNNAVTEAPPAWARDVVTNFHDKSRMLRSFFSQLDDDVVAEVASLRPDMQVHVVFSCALAWRSAPSASDVLRGLPQAHKCLVADAGTVVSPTAAKATVNLVIIQVGFPLGIGHVALKAALNLVLQDCSNVMVHVLDCFSFVQGDQQAAMANAAKTFLQVKCIVAQLSTMPEVARLECSGGQNFQLKFYL